MHGAGLLPPPPSPAGSNPISKDGQVSKNGDSVDNSPEKNPDLESLRKKWRFRVEVAKALILDNIYVSTSVAQNLARKFSILTESIKSGQMTDDLKNFLALTLAQCNLINLDCLNKLEKIFDHHNNISEDGNRRKPSKLKGIEKNLGETSRADNLKSGSYSMAVERQSFVESDIKTNFTDKKMQQQIKNTLVLLKNQITTGSNIGPIPDNVVTLEFDNPESTQKFATYFKYPNEEIFAKERDEYKNTISGFENKIPEQNITKLIKNLRAIIKDSDEDSTTPQKTFTEQDIKQIKDNLEKPITDMSTEALLLASFAPNLDTKMKDYLKSCHILALKTPEKKEAGEASNTDPSASAINKDVKSKEAKHQELAKQRDHLAKALLDSDAIKRGFIEREGFPKAPKHAANALIQSLTAATGIPV